MRHQVRKKKFGLGQDANEMLLRKLSRNFFLHGKLTTTASKTKALRPHVERLVHLAKKNTEGTRNVLLSKMGDSQIVSVLIKQIAPVFQPKNGGYVRIVKIGTRHNDGSEVSRLEWTLPVVLEGQKVKEPVEVLKDSVKDSPKAKPKKTVSATPKKSKSSKKKV